MNRRDAATRIADLLGALREARDAERDPRNASPRLTELKRWQGRRLAKGFADLALTPRYTAAAAFFVDDLYSERDASWRDRDVARMLPTLRAWLPKSMLQTVGAALELDLLSHRLDVAMVEELDARLAPDQPIDDRAYALAYRRAGTRADRERQIDLLLDVGYDLDSMVRKPLIFTILRLARGPALRAGLDQLQGFLERGFGAFKAIGGADVFLTEIERREHEVLRRLYAGHAAPFDVAASVAEMGERRNAGLSPARGPGASRSRSRSRT